MAVIDKRPEAFSRLPSDFSGQTIAGIGFDRDRLHGGRHRAGRRRSPPSPTATTPTSSSPASPARPSASSASSPASTTPAGPPSTSGSASPPSPPWPGRPSGSCAASCPTRPAVEWIDPSARVSLVERIDRRRLGGPPAARARGAGQGPGRGGQPPGRGPDARRPTSSSRRATSCTSPWPATRSTPSTGSLRRAGQGEGTDMRVVIAGGGSVGRFIAEQLHEAGHDVLILDNDPAVVRQAERPASPRACRGSRPTPARSPQLAEAEVDKADVVAAVTGDDEDNLVDLAAGQAGVRRAARRRPRQQPEERVDVQRDVGRRRRGVDAAPHHRPRAGGGRASARSCACCRSRAARRKLAEVTLADGLAGRRQGDRRARPAPRRHRGRRHPQGAGHRAPGRHA